MLPAVPLDDPFPPPPSRLTIQAVFKPPQWNTKHLEQRILTNLLHYRSNYLLICTGIFILRIVFAPFMLLSLLCVGLFCFYVLAVLTKPIVINDDLTLTLMHKQAACAVVSIVFLVLSGSLEKLLWTLLYCLVIIASHMVFRPRSVTSKTGKVRFSVMTAFARPPHSLTPTPDRLKHAVVR